MLKLSLEEVKDMPYINQIITGKKQDLNITEPLTVLFFKKKKKNLHVLPADYIG